MQYSVSVSSFLHFSEKEVSAMEDEEGGYSIIRFRKRSRVLENVKGYIRFLKKKIIRTSSINVGTRNEE